jgi:hypothetical protein
MASTLPPEFEHPLLHAPDFFRLWPSWAAWSAPTKRPLDLRRALAAAAVNKPDTWASWQHALLHLKKTAPAIPYRPPVPIGVGILIAPPLVFVDFDDLHDDKGRMPDWATNFMTLANKAGAYTEISAGGQGAHILLRATPDFVLRRNRYTRSHPSSTPVGIELYQRDRFCALTGLLFPEYRSPNPNLNNPEEGDRLLSQFVSDLEANAAPILTPNLPPAPLSVPLPTQPIIDLLPSLMTANIRRAFSDPSGAYDEWQTRRLLSGTDNSLSAWRFSLFLEASRQCPPSPAPVYELFNPQTDPAHPGVFQWQEFSGHSKKPHRKYADIQRAHAMVKLEFEMLARDLGEPPPPPDPAPSPDINQNEPPDPSWQQLGLVMKTGKNGATRPLATSVNFIRVIARHPLFSRHRIERNMLDGSTLCDRLPLLDTQITRWLEPLRAVLDMSQDPPVQGVRDAIEVIADDNPYDPLIEYMSALPSFTPAPDYNPDTSLLSSWLEKVGAAPGPDTKKFARRILLGLVARALRPGIKFDYVPVFEGPQGVGKSSLVKALVSPQFYATLFGGLASKDAPMTLRGRWGVELAELVAFKKSDNETMKSFFSTDTDVFRPPYARNLITVLRRTVLFGTTNDKQYNSDFTGARRIWPVYFPGEIDIKWFLANRDMLFAEAKYFFEHGERYHDTLEEIQSEHRQQQMQARLITPAWQVKLLQHIQSLPKPSIPQPPDNLGFSGVLTGQYVSGLQTALDLPNSVQHMTAAQLGSFIQRAGFYRLPNYSYRPVDGLPTKFHGYAHPAFRALSDSQLKAFLSNFPALFSGKQAPTAWLALQAEHLESAISAIEKAPDTQKLDFGGETE